MAKRMTDVERVTAYFQTADESAARVMLQVVKGIIDTKHGSKAVPRKTRGPNKPKTQEAGKSNGLATNETV